MNLTAFLHTAMSISAKYQKICHYLSAGPCHINLMSTDNKSYNLDGCPCVFIFRRYLKILILYTVRPLTKKLPTSAQSDSMK